MKTLLLLLGLCLSLYADIGTGEKAPYFKLPTLDSTQMKSLQSYKGDVILLNIWASWCKGCQKEMPEFFKLQKAYKKGFKIITVSVDDNPQKAQTFLKNVANKVGFNIPFISLHDKDKRVAKAYRCSAMPSSYLIDKKGIIKEVIVGSLNNHEITILKKEIDQLK